MNFNPGDVLMVDIPENILVYIEDLPSYHAKLGQSHGRLALKISSVLERPKGAKTDLSFIKGNSIEAMDDGDVEEFDDD